MKTHPSPLLSALLLTALVFFASGCAIPSGGIPLPGNQNLHQVDSRLFRSAQPSVTGFGALAERGIKTVINLRMPDDVLPEEEAAVRAKAMTYHHVPLGGWGRPTEAQVNEILALIETAVPPVLVHCQRGADRTGTIVACYRIRHEGWTAEQALAEAEHLGMAWGEFGMKSFVRDFALNQPPHPSAPSIRRGTSDKEKALP
jgi:uncharacterized protein (TIGR01244 family)